jgi:hypothetical protein
VERAWQVEVIDVNRQPKIEDTSPPTDSVELTAGDLREFSVKASDPDKDDQLVYVWSLDGSKVAEGERWTFRASSRETPYRVTVAVMDKGGLTDQRAWNVSTKAPPPPAVLPEITQADPKVGRGQEITVAEGQRQIFTIKAESPQKSPLQYAWLLDGKKQAEGERWTYQSDFTEVGAKPREIKAVITDREGHRVEKVWRVRIRKVNRPPEIVAASPLQTELTEMAAGEVQDFSVEASDPDQDDQLTYVWSLNGKEVARGQRWEFRMPSSESKHTVVVKALDKAGLKAQQRWTVATRAPALPPSIIHAQPRNETVTIEAEQPLDFSVTADFASNARETGKTLRYQWSVDDAPPSITETGHFRWVEANPGKHRLTVAAISPEGLKSAPRSWTIEVRSREVGSIMEAEVRNWLEAYRRVWEGKNVDTLVRLGEISSQRAARLRDVLQGYKDFRVAFEDVQIRIQGNQATVTLSRVDTIDGKTLPQPDRKVLVLEKQADGRIVRRMEK